MSYELHLDLNATRETLYTQLLPQIQAMLAGETDLIARMANTAAAIKQGLGFFWVGFYVFKQDQLVVGPFQGPPACSRIALGKGVCGTAAQEKKTLIVPDVHAFAGHIACSDLSRSEIVVPMLDQAGQLLAVLDIDSDQLDDFHPIDQVYLERIVKMVCQ